MALVQLPSSLVVLFPGAPRRIELDAATVHELIEALDSRWPGIRDRLVDGGEIRQFIHVYVDGERASLGDPVPGNATVHIIPAMAGG